MSPKVSSRALNRHPPSALRLNLHFDDDHWVDIFIGFNPLSIMYTNTFDIRPVNTGNTSFNAFLFPNHSRHRNTSLLRSWSLNLNVRPK